MSSSLFMSVRPDERNVQRPPDPARKGHCELLPNVLRRHVLNPPDNAYDSIAAAEFLSLHMKLTRRQAQVLHWIAEGKSNQEIALVLQCSFFTVKNHVKEIFVRLGVSSRVGAVAVAYRAHLNHLAAEPPPPANRAAGAKKKGPSRRRMSPSNGATPTASSPAASSSALPAPSRPAHSRRPTPP